MFERVLVANRGEIACRVIRTLRKLGIESIAVYSEVDRFAPHVAMADNAVCLGGGPVGESYLNIPRVLEALRSTGAQALHPGYGLLSENSDFAEACEVAGVAFIGPTPEQMRVFGLKHSAREIAVAQGVPLVPGSGLLADADEAVREAERIGYPVMLKSTAGGGGIGMRCCGNAAELRDAFESVSRLGKANFGSGGVFVEKFVDRARHVEVQIFGDGRGHVVALGERDCSTQRRNQKIIEETPAPGLSGAQRQGLLDAALKLARAVGYRSAGTVEFVLDADTGEFYFLEVNARLQVEHGVTELVTGIDLVEWMVRVAAGEDIGLATYRPNPKGAAIEVRLCAEDPNKDFQPSSGLLTAVSFPEGVRCDTWVRTGAEVSPFYDSLIAKLLVLAPDRDSARLKLADALAQTTLAGIETNLAFLRKIVDGEIFAEGRMTTRSLKGFAFHPRTVDVLEPGTQTTVQDFPGRLGYWNVGVPPSGPMDALSFRLVNRLLGNSESAAGLEMVVSGPTLRFNTDTWICLGGAVTDAKLDGGAVPSWTPVEVRAGQTLAIGSLGMDGTRAYLAVRGGLDVPLYLGSRSTFTLGGFGGHAGRPLRVGDVLPQGSATTGDVEKPLPDALQPRFTREWELGVIYGPHGAPEFFTAEDMTMFFGTSWEVHYNSARTGVRLVGPKPQWARHDGGEAGLHPSNIHDSAYGIGSVDFTGDMPILLGPDGPSLGGFVCPAAVVKSEMWKMGQFRPGDRVRFKLFSAEEAMQALEAQEKSIRTLQPVIAPVITVKPAPIASAVLHRIGDPGSDEEIVFRPSGDSYLLVEFGPLHLDLALRFRVHAFYLEMEIRSIGGIIDLTPGIRSLQVHFDSRRLGLRRLIGEIESIARGMPPLDALELPARIVHLPLSWDDPATQEAIRRYTQGVRPDAPWCPSNIEFIRRINGLDSIEDVKHIVFDASYVVLGLGDVYLGAPVATPLDPRHRLVTTKYNPARTWTPENAVGIGGAYMCIYGMEGPGGYQFVGRTVQVWNKFLTNPAFAPGQPWLLRFFDQIRYYPVSAEELLELRRDFPHGRWQPRIETTNFSLHAYRDFLQRESASIQAFKQRQQQAFEAERARWQAQGSEFSPEAEVPEAWVADELDGLEPLASPVAGNLWKWLVQPGDHVEAGQTVAILEAMKMELHVPATASGRVARVLRREGQTVAPGDALLTFEVP